MRKKKKAQSEYILDVLIDSKALKLRDITKMVSNARRKETKVENISSMLTKLCNPENAAIGHFLNRTKIRRRYEYRLVPEILALSPHEIYDLSRNTGRDRFTLRMAKAFMLIRIKRLNLTNGLDQ
jgi:hypothetical protein